MRQSVWATPRRHQPGNVQPAFTHGTNSSTSAGGLWSAALTKAANDTTVTVGPGPLNSGNLLNVAVVLGANSSETTNINVKGVGNLAVGFSAAATSPRTE